MMTFLKHNVVVVQPHGRLDEAGGQALKQALHKLSQDDRTRWMVDLSRVDFIDTAGLGSLVNGLQLAKMHQRHFVLHDPHPCVKLVLEITGLDEVFEIVDARHLAQVMSTDVSEYADAALLSQSAA